MTCEFFLMFVLLEERERVVRVKHIKSLLIKQDERMLNSAVWMINVVCWDAKTWQVMWYAVDEIKFLYKEFLNYFLKTKNAILWFLVSVRWSVRLTVCRNGRELMTDHNWSSWPKMWDFLHKNCNGVIFSALGLKKLCALGQNILLRKR